MAGSPATRKSCHVASLPLSCCCRSRLLRLPLLSKQLFQRLDLYRRGTRRRSQADNFCRAGLQVRLILPRASAARRRRFSATCWYQRCSWSCRSASSSRPLWERSGDTVLHDRGECLSAATGDRGGGRGGIASVHFHRQSELVHTAAPPRVHSPDIKSALQVQPRRHTASGVVRSGAGRVGVGLWSQPLD